MLDTVKVKRLIKARKLTQQKVAEACYVSLSTMDRILNGHRKRPVPPEYIKDIAKALGCEVSEILKGDG